MSQTFTPTAGTLTCTVTGSVTNAQIEAGGFVTSWIPSASAAVTRAQDQCGIPAANMAPWFTTTGSWFAEFILIDPAPSGDRIVGAAAVADGGIAPLTAATAPYQLGLWDGSSFGAVTNNITSNIVQKGASTSTGAASRASICLNGGPVAAAPINNGFAALAASGVRFLNTVAGTSTENGNGYIRRVLFWSRALSDTEMQQVTT